MMKNGRTISRNEVKNTAWEYIAGGFGTAAKLAAKGFAGAVVGGVRLTTEVIIPEAAKGVSDAIEWGRRNNKK